MDYPKSVPSVGLVNGKFVDENPVTGQVGSLISSEWGNAVTDELLNVIRAGGDEPVEAEHDQLLAAIKAIVKDSIPPEKIRTTLAAYGITDAYTKSVTYTKAEIEALLKNMSALPVGAMVPFPKGTVPAGFLEVDGSVQSIAALPDLAAYLGTTFNTGGEGAGNFRLPESRGEFLRGWDHGRGMDPGRFIGSAQHDTLQNIVARLDAAPNALYQFLGEGVIAGGAFAVTERSANGFPDAGVGGGQAGALTFDASRVARTSSETRPHNIAVMWCIKAWNAPINQGQVDVAALVLEMQRLRALSGVGGHKGLVVSATGTNAIISVKATGLIVGSGATAQALNGVDVNINLQTPGLNGLDVGSLAASSWYSSWVVTNGAQVAGIAALMPVIQGTTTAGSSVVTGIASTASMRAGMRLGGASFPPGVFIKSVDSASQITVSTIANATAANTVLRFVYEPVLPAGYVAMRVGSFFTDATVNKFPLSFVQAGKSVQYKLAASSNLLTYPVIASGSTSFIATPAAVGAFVPPTAFSIGVSIRSAVPSLAIGVGPSPALDQNNCFAFMSQAAQTYFNALIPSRFLLESANIYFISNTADCVVKVHGWEESL